MALYSLTIGIEQNYIYSSVCIKPIHKGTVTTVYNGQIPCRNSYHDNFVLNENKRQKSGFLLQVT